MTEKMQDFAGLALIAMALAGAATGAATGATAAQAFATGALALAMAVWAVRVWVWAPDMTPAQRHTQVIVPVVLTAVLMPTLVLAGGGATGDFADAYDTLVEWAEGDLGRIISVGLLVVGLAAGIVRQSVMAAAPAAAAGLALSVGPGIIDEIFGAAL